MPARFKEVVPNLLYRGGVPKDWEIVALKENFGIQQIISLDENAAEKIHKTCIDNSLEHVIIPIRFHKLSGALSVIENGVSSIVGNKISYVHCHHGKDRTGLFVAKYRVENGWDCAAALDEALSFGFGVGADVNLDIFKRYIEIIVASCKSNHEHVDINYYLKKMKIAKLCDECGLTKNGIICGSCIITNSLIKNANIFNKDIVNETRNKLEEKDMQSDDKNLPGVDEVSTLFSVPGILTTASKRFRRNILKAAVLSKTSQSHQISFVVPKIEKQNAKSCIEKLQTLIDEVLLKTKIKDDEIDILDIIYNPFNENQGITTEQTKKIKKHIDIFLHLLNNNMIQVKKYAADCLAVLEKFDSDADVAAMNKSFFDDVDNIDKEELLLEGILKNVDNKDFQKDTLSSIKILKKYIAQLKQLVNDRIIPYLRKDILGENWTTEIKQTIEDDKEEQKEDLKKP